MDFNSDDKDRILKGLESYLKVCDFLKESKDKSYSDEDREYFKVESNELRELIDRISS
jgi:hypothetical protein